MSCIWGFRPSRRRSRHLTALPCPRLSAISGRATSLEVDWEATRYLSAATQLDPAYARQVVRRIIGEPFRAVAPAAGADVVAVTRWALAALQRQARRDAVLAGLLLLGIIAVVVFWTWLVLASLAVAAILVVAYERWIRDEKVIAPHMLRGRFRACDAPASSDQRIEERLAVAEKQQGGNIVVFLRSFNAFVGSGKCSWFTTALLCKWPSESGKRTGRDSSRFRSRTWNCTERWKRRSRVMGFPELRVGERLYVNGQHVAAKSPILPDLLKPPVASAPFELLYNGCVHPTPDARTYMCAEIRGWKGQLVVSLFARAVQARGSLQVEWRFQVIPPLREHFLAIDSRYELPKVRQVVNALAAGVAGFAPALISSPVRLARYLRTPLDDRRRFKQTVLRDTQRHRIRLWIRAAASGRML